MKKYQKCYPSEVSMKSLFLGPKAENSSWLLEQMLGILNNWFLWRKKLNPYDGPAVSAFDQNLKEFINKQNFVSENLKHLAALFEKEVPQFSPRYIGHMFSEVNLPALLGHFISLLHNPNIISHESAKVGIKIENEAIGWLNQMIGFKGNHGHFTSGGTVANFESLIRSKERIFLWALMLATENQVLKTKNELWQTSSCGWKRFHKLFLKKEIRRQFQKSLKELNSSESKRIYFKEMFGTQNNDPVVLIPQHKHYSWMKGCSFIGLDPEQVRYLDLDADGKVDLKKLDRDLGELKKENRPIQMIVSVFGTTELGFVDPIDKILQLLKKNKVPNTWCHIDGAFGGFFATLKTEPKLFTQKAFQSLKAMKLATSVTIDPHKMGYVPYSSGAFLCAHREDYYLQSFFGPYVVYEEKVDRGPYTLEGSRPGTGATAMWMTAKSIPLNSQGLGQIIKRTLRTKKDLEILLRESHPGIRIAHSTDLNILCFCLASEGDSFLSVNKKTKSLLNKMAKKKEGFIVSQTILKYESYSAYIEKLSQQWKCNNKQSQKKDLMLIRVTVMNPFFDSKEFKINFKKEFVNFVLKNIDEGSKAKSHMERKG